MTYADRISEILVDSSERIEHIVFGSCCVLTLCVFLFVVVKMLISPTRPPNSELIIIVLSCVQLFLGSWYYIVDDESYINILNKGIKVLQCQVISWSCMYVLMKSKRTYYMSFKLFSGIFTTLLVALLFYALSSGEVPFYLRINIYVSFLWLAMSSIILAIAVIIRRRLKFAMLFKFDVEEVIDVEIQKLDNEMVDTFTNSKFSQFFLLSSMEFGTSLVTWLWDVIIYFTVKKNEAMNIYELNMPMFKEFLHIITNSLLILIPNWTIFFVFYW
ncbi:conserved hypothetical protein [Theileria orientalis strain Shintoku]|uniref:Uncharacterized protein n=1 Tax=Theileria orientalis strain Shintoku TaxID=869250 RepID=J4DPL7_THEOR|nr:conserved hypothetical protein [Theileria orientalis strain Shintoku]BAM40924.1 conserved hypothetical protein [Theileria orientalis strain Shintoku]|eukprot:XP_009691225.1 conserved hypothetical protein [Theileria orientalis strain Shintoku]